jgi:hypothetical protein
MNSRQTDSGYSGESDTGGVVTEQVKQTTQQALQQTQQAAGQVAESAKSNATSYAETQKQTATQNLHTVASALHQTGQNVATDGSGPIANYTNMAGDKVEAFAQYLESTPVTELLNDVEDFARRNSTLFLGGAFALGLAAARFLKASAPRRNPPYSSQSYGYGSGTNYGGSLSSGSGYGTDSGYASSTGYGDSGYGSSSPAVGVSETVVVDEVEYPDATVFDAEGETTNGSSI